MSRSPDMTRIGKEHDAGLRLAERPGGRHDGPPSPPAPVDHNIAQPAPGPESEDVRALLAALSGATGHLWDHGDLLWQRTADWEKTKRIAPPSLREDDEEQVSDREAEERQGDALADRFRPEVRQLAKRIRTDLARLAQIDAIVIRAQPERLKNRDLLAAQAAADGWCLSCFRDDQFLSPIAVRPGTNQPYYRDRCRPCGEWKSANGEDPPIDVLRTRHRGGRVRVKAG